MAAYSQASAPPPYSEVLTSTNPTSFTSSIPATQVELHVSCRNLADLDVFSKSDPSIGDEGMERAWKNRSHHEQSQP
ncbi:Copine-5 [Exaiptasia diaphana]|nr:Copine-5 [Exaiptasia diaphana]